MTKISIDVDFNKDPEIILQEIQEKAKTEVRKREKKERAAAHLEILHNKVNEAIGTSYNNANELIRALAVYATPTLRGRILGVTSSGRRKTVTMTNQLCEKIKASLAKGENTKAEIAREHGISPTQVTKVERGGYDAKYGENAIPESPSKLEVSDELDSLASEESSDADSDQAELSIPDLEPKQEELPMPDSLPSPFPSEPQSTDEVEDAKSDQGEEEDLESFGDLPADSPEPNAPLPLEPTLPLSPEVPQSGTDESSEQAESEASIHASINAPMPPPPPSQAYQLLEHHPFPLLPQNRLPKLKNPLLKIHQSHIKGKKFPKMIHRPRLMRILPQPHLLEGLSPASGFPANRNRPSSWASFPTT